MTEAPPARSEPIVSIVARRARGGAATARDAWLGFPMIWRRAVIATAGLWAVVLLLGVLAAGTFPALDPVGVPNGPGFGGWPPPSPDATGFALLRTLLERFDALWYLAIARDGYPSSVEVPQAAAFFPAYPLLVRAASVTVRDSTLVAAMLVSTGATVACFAGVQALVGLLPPRSSGSADPLVQLQRRAVLVLLLFPTSFFLLAPYSESLFLAASLWALVLAGRHQPQAAVLLAVVAGATRPVGALLVIPLLLGMTALQESPAPRARVWLRDRLVPAAGVGIGLGAVLLYGLVRWGDPLAPLTAQSAWSRGWAWPWDTVTQAVRFSFGQLGAPTTGYQLLDLLMLVVAVVGLVTLAVTHRRDRLAIALIIHGAANVLVWLVQPFDGRPLLSVPRFALVVPGVVVGLAALTRRVTVERAWTVLSVVLLATHLLLFTRWWYVF